MKFTIRIEQDPNETKEEFDRAKVGFLTLDGDRDRLGMMLGMILACSRDTVTALTLPREINELMRGQPIQIESHVNLQNAQFWESTIVRKILG